MLAYYWSGILIIRQIDFSLAYRNAIVKQQDINTVYKFKKYIKKQRLALRILYNSQDPVKTKITPKILLNKT